MQEMIVVSKLSKSYGGKRVVEELNFSLKRDVCWDY